MSTFLTKVLLATDGSPEADLALRAAVELVEKTASELHLIHAWAMPLQYHPERPRLSEAPRRTAERGPTAT